MDFEPPSPRNRLPLVKVQPGHDTEATIATTRMLRLTTHFSGHTFLCAGQEACALCNSVATRDLWYLPALVGSRNSRALLELSSVAAMDIEQLARFAGHDNLLGCRFRLFRRGSKKPIRSELIGHDGSVVEHELSTWLSPIMAIYSLPPANPGDSLESYFSRLLPVVIRRAQLANERLSVRFRN